MAAGDAPATFSELRTDFLESVKEPAGSAINTIVNRFLNKALQYIHEERWWWAERRATIQTKAPYTTGTIAVTEGSTTVTGTSTAWATADAYGQNNARAGDKMTLGSDAVVHVIATVGSATSITLTDRYTGSTISSDGGYAVFQDEYALAADFDDVIDTRFFDDAHTISLIGAREFYWRYVRNSTRSTPKYATLIELGPSGSVALRRRVVVGPAPDQTYIIPYRYYTTNLAVSAAGVGAANLSADADQPIIPIRFRQLIILRAKQEWYSTREKNAALAEEARQDYQTLLARASASKGPADDQPQLVPRLAGYWHQARTPYTSLEGRRLVTGTRWDQFQE